MILLIVHIPISSPNSKLDSASDFDPVCKFDFGFEIISVSNFDSASKFYPVSKIYSVSKFGPDFKCDLIFKFDCVSKFYSISKTVFRFQNFGSV